MQHVGKKRQTEKWVTHIYKWKIKIQKMCCIGAEGKRRGSSGGDGGAGVIIIKQSGFNEW